MLSLLNGLHFLRPEAFLWMLAALVLASMFWYGKLRLDRKARKRYGEEHLVNRFTEPLWMLGQTTVLASWLVAIGLLFTAIAGPVLPDSPVRVKSGSLQVVILSDVSRSMAAEDYRDYMPSKNGVPAANVPGPYGTRLDMMKKVVGEEIMPAILGNEMGIATYMGNGWDACDLNDDFSYVRATLNSVVKIGNAPGGGSDYSEGLKEALILFKQTPAPDKQKIIVWFTDGGFTGNQVELAKVLEQVRLADIRVIIIGLGSENQVPIPVYDDSTGQQTGFIQKDGKTVTTAIDEGSINNLTTALNAEYHRLIPGTELGIKWASKLAGGPGKVEAHETEVFEYPLGASMLIVFVLLLRGLVPALRRRTTQTS
jgi:Ca-activated chloride channel family protein